MTFRDTLAERHINAVRTGQDLLTIRLFRSLQLHWRGQQSPLPARRHPQRLLALLLLDCRGILFERDEIARRLWPDDELRFSKPRLRLCLHGLLQCLPSGEDGKTWIVRDDHKIGWRADAPCEVDAWALDVAGTDVDQQHGRSPSTLRKRIVQLQAASALYTGTLLPTFDDLWLADHRTHFDNVYRHVVAELIDCLLAAGDRYAALIAARRLILHDVSDESAHARVMHLHLEASDRDAALRQFEECSRELGALGLAPSYELASLAADVRAGKAIAPVIRDSQASAPPPCMSPPVDPHPFIDAQQRVKSLASVLHRSRLVACTGPCGAGKSRVVREMVRAQLPLWHADGLPAYWHDCDLLPPPSLDVDSPAHAADVSIADDLIDTLALTLGVPIGAVARVTYARVVEALDRDAITLVLDNIDLHLEVWADLIGRLLAYCRRLRIVYTARVPIRFPGEFVWRVPLLATHPPSAGSAARQPAASMSARAGAHAAPTISTRASAPASEACQLYTALGGGLPIPLPARQPAASAVDTWIAEADGLPLAAMLLAQFSQRTSEHARRTMVPPDPALRAALWSAGRSDEPSAAKPHAVAAPPTPPRHASLPTAYTHTLAALSPNARSLLSVLLAAPPPLTPRTVQAAWHADASARHPEEAAAGVYSDVFDPANRYQPITGEWIDGLVELERASIITVTIREGEATVYRIRDGVRTFLGAGGG